MTNEKKFVAPEAEIIKFPKQDIVTTSGGGSSSEEEPKKLLSGGNGLRLYDIDW